MMCNIVLLVRGERLKTFKIQKFAVNVESAIVP